MGLAAPAPAPPPPREAELGAQPIPWGAPRVAPSPALRPLCAALPDMGPARGPGRVPSTFNQQMGPFGTGPLHALKGEAGNSRDAPGIRPPYSPDKPRFPLALLRF